MEFSNAKRLHATERSEWERDIGRVEIKFRFFTILSTNETEEDEEEEED